MARAARVTVQTIATVEHAGTSNMGNPTYRVTFTDGVSALTVSNSGWAYEATNSDNHGVPLEVTWSGSRIAFCKKVKL